MAVDFTPETHYQPTMAKKFWRDTKGMFVQNGASIVKVAMVCHMRIDTHKGRVIKQVVVNEIIRQDPKNFILPGCMLALSFREQDVNRSEYVWRGDEEFQVTLKAVPLDSHGKVVQDDPFAEPEG